MANTNTDSLTILLIALIGFGLISTMASETSFGWGMMDDQDMDNMMDDQDMDNMMDDQDMDNMMDDQDMDNMMDDQDMDNMMDDHDMSNEECVNYP